jgi:hypothetical protein
MLAVAAFVANTSASDMCVLHFQVDTVHPHQILSVETGDHICESFAMSRPAR